MKAYQYENNNRKRNIIIEIISKYKMKINNIKRRNKIMKVMKIIISIENERKEIEK